MAARSGDDAIPCVAVSKCQQCLQATPVVQPAPLQSQTQLQPVKTSGTRGQDGFSG